MVHEGRALHLEDAFVSRAICAIDQPHLHLRMRIPYRQFGLWQPPGVGTKNHWPGFGSTVAIGDDRSGENLADPSQ